MGHRKNTYSQEMIDKWKYAVVIRVHSDSAYFAIKVGSKMTHQENSVVMSIRSIELRSFFGSEIRKYYVFASQFDVQLFENTMTFIEK